MTQFNSKTVSHMLCQITHSLTIAINTIKLPYMSPILEHEHQFVAVHFMDQMYLTDEQKKKLGVDPSIDWYTSNTCLKRGCTATRLDSSVDPVPVEQQPVVDADAYKLSTQGRLH